MCLHESSFFFADYKIFIKESPTVKLTLTFFAALAIHICQGRIKRTVREGANQSFTLHSAILEE